MRNLNETHQRKPSEPDDIDAVPGKPAVDLRAELRGADVEVKVANADNSYMAYTPFNSSAEPTPFITDRSYLVPAIQQHCNLFGSLSISIENDDDGLCDLLARYVNSYCPRYIRQSFTAKAKTLRSRHAFQRITDLTLYNPDEARDLDLHFMFPNVERVKLHLQKSYRIKGRLPKLADVEIYQKSRNLIYLNSLAVYAPEIRSIRIDVWWDPRYLQEINELFPQLESLHISYRDDGTRKPPKRSLFDWFRTKSRLHFRNVRHFAVDFYDFSGPFEGCVENLASITFAGLESMEYIASSRDLSSTDKIVDLITRTKAMTSVAVNAHTFRHSQLVKLLDRLPKLKHLTVFLSSDVGHVVQLMSSPATLETITANGDDAMRKQFAWMKPKYDSHWALRGDGFHSLPHMPKLRSLTFQRVGLQ